MLISPAKRSSFRGLLRTLVPVAAAAVFVLGLATPAAADWTRQRYPEWPNEDDTMSAVTAVTAEHGFAFGSEKGQSGTSPILLETKNAGAEWMRIPMDVGDPNNPLSGMQMYMDFDFVDANIGYGIKFDIAVDINNPLFVEKTVNGGGQWTRQNVADPIEGPIRLFALDAEHVWVTGDEAAVQYTANGLTWQKSSLPGVDEGVTCLGVHFIDELHGWVTCGKTEDITETDWEGNETVVGQRVLPHGTVARTVDGGATWETLRSQDPHVYVGVAFATEARGLLIGWNDAGPFLMETSDGGQSWDIVDDLPAGPGGKDYLSFTAIRCPDPVNCWIVGGAGIDGGGFTNLPVFLHSANGGMTWDIVEPDEGQGVVADIDFLGPHRAWAGGNFGQIWHWDDGVDPGPIGPGEDAGGGEPDAGPTVGPWAGVLGAFEDGQVPAAPGAGGNGGNGSQDTAGGHSDGGMPVGGPDAGAGSEDCGSSGGCAAGSADPSGPAALGLLLILALAAALGLRRRSGAALSTLSLALTLALAPACDSGGGDCADPGTGGGGGVDIVAPEDLSEPEPPAPTDGPYCVNRLDAAPAVRAGGAARTNGGDPRAVVARAADGGGSDLWLFEPIGGTWSQLTFFDSPDVEVWDPAWSPDRQQVVFVSDFMADRSGQAANLFVVGVDGADCRQVTPAAGAGVLAAADAPSGQVQGKLLLPLAHGLQAPGDGAVAIASTGGVAVTTDANGAFLLDVPAGAGMIHIRRESDEGIYTKSVPFEVEADGYVDLGNLLADAESQTARLANPTWAADGQGFVYRREVVRHTEGGDRDRVQLRAIGVDGAGAVDLQVAENADLGRPVFVGPTGELLLGVDGLGLTFAAADDPTSSTLTVPLDTFDPRARPAWSPHRFIAAVVPAEGARELVVVGADGAGELETMLATSFRDDSLAWDGVDWAPNGQLLLLSREDGAGGRDLWLLDATNWETRQLTDDGRCRGAAWYGR